MKYKIQITYKSGKVQIVKCDKMIATRNNAGELSSLEFDNLSPKTLYLGINNIESIFQLSK